MVPPNYHAKLEILSPTYIEIPHQDPGGAICHHFLFNRHRVSETVLGITLFSGLVTILLVKILEVEILVIEYFFT